MSLKRLMKSFMTIQTSEFATQSKQGSIDRQKAWVNISEFTNIRCHVQERSKQTVTERFARLDEEHGDIIYHSSLALFNYRPSDQLNQVSLRIIVNADDSTTKLVFPVSNKDIGLKIYEWNGHIEQVAAKRRRWKFFILRCQRNNRDR